VIFLASTLFLAAQIGSEQYTVEYFTPPEGEVVEVGGIAFTDEGDALVSTRRGRVWWIEDALADNPQDATWHLFAEGLHEGLGLNVIDGEIFIIQRGEISKLIDRDGDFKCDRIETITQDWGMTGNYHEFAFGLPADDEGNLYFSLNLGFWSPEWWHGLSRAPYRGWILKMTPDGEVIPVAPGVRSPCGLGMNSAGDLFYTDNQGDWMASSPVFHVQPDRFYGHPGSLRWTEDYLKEGRIPSSTIPVEREREAAAVWLPYPWSRSTGNLVESQNGGQFGPFDGQMFVAELTEGRVLRVQMEKVAGEYQGAAFRFRDAIGSVCRVAFAPDGSLFTGFTNRGWGGRSPGYGLARVRWNGETVFDMHGVSLTEDGFIVNFTEALGKTPAASEIVAESYDYNYWWDYGSPQQRFENHKVLGATLSSDRKELRIRLEGLEPGRVMKLKLPQVRSQDGVALLHDEVHYTINRTRDGRFGMVSKQVAPPAEKTNESEGWLHLTWGDATDRWTGEGWELCDVELDPADPSKLLTRPGMGAIATVGDRVSNLTSKQEFGDCEFFFRFMMPKGGDSGLYFHERYELQLVDDASGCLGVIGAKNPRVLDAYRGPGEWHVATGRFIAPRFDANGNKIRNAQFEQISIDGVMVVGSAEPGGPTGGGKSGEVSRAPLYFQGGYGKACIGDVRIRPLADEQAPQRDGTWQPLFERGLEGLRQKGAANWEFVDGVMTGKGDAGSVTASVSWAASDFVLQSRVRIAEGAPAAFVVVTDQGEIRMPLDASPGPQAKTGSMSIGDEVHADLIPGGTWFDFELERAASNWSLSLNGVSFQQVAAMAGAKVQAVRIEVAEGAEVEIAESRVLR